MNAIKLFKLTLKQQEKFAEIARQTVKNLILCKVNFMLISDFSDDAR